MGLSQRWSRTREHKPEWLQGQGEEERKSARKARSLIKGRILITGSCIDWVLVPETVGRECACTGAPISLEPHRLCPTRLRNSRWGGSLWEELPKHILDEILQGSAVERVSKLFFQLKATCQNSFLLACNDMYTCYILYFSFKKINHCSTLIACIYPLSKFKGTVLCFWLCFFHQSTSPSPIRHAEKGFRICSNIWGVICICNQLPVVFTTREST